jgi:septum formation protein
LNEERTAAHLVLASASPRRAALLRSVGLPFTTRPVDIDESVAAGEAAAPYVERLARAKATAQVHDGEVVIGADTTVVLDDAIIGKPVDPDDARRILRTLSGRTHTVFTGVAVATTARVASGVARTEVTFAELPDTWIDRYVATGEPLDKAGAYGMQDGAALFVIGIAGSPSNVIGLPLHLLPQLGVVL